MGNERLLKDYITGLLTSDKDYCHSLIMEAIDKDVEIREIYSSIFHPSMVYIGELWQANKLSVAQEHLATAITQSIICSMYHKIFTTKPLKNKGKVIMTCASNELHELGTRMLSDILEIDGFNVNFLGANMPPYAVMEMIEKESPLIVGISCTMSFNIKYVKDLILRLKNAIPAQVPVLVGGRAFDIDKKLVQYVGADYYAREFTETLELLNKLSLQTKNNILKL
jgi:MerR family transcriptional regulator, light-induced transcriptional regulator